MEEELEKKFLTSFCDYLETNLKDPHYKTALEELKKSKNYEESYEQKISLLQIFKSSQSSNKSVDNFLDFPLNISYETVKQLYLLIFFKKDSICICHL